MNATVAADSRSGRGSSDVTGKRHSGHRPACAPAPPGPIGASANTTGDIVWQVPLGITDQLPEGKQNTGRPVLAGPIVTAAGLLFIASTDDNRFRAFDAKSGKGPARNKVAIWRPQI